MAKWFFHVTCFSKVYLILFFFLVPNMIFYKKVVTWKLQHFYHKVMMLSFIHCWDYCRKCEFDTDVKIENCNHHDGEQSIFYKKVHTKTQSNKKDVLVIFTLLLYSGISNNGHLCTRATSWYAVSKESPYRI